MVSSRFILGEISGCARPARADAKIGGSAYGIYQASGQEFRSDVRNGRRYLGRLVRYSAIVRRHAFSSSRLPGVAPSLGSRSSRRRRRRALQIHFASPVRSAEECAFRQPKHEPMVRIDRGQDVNFGSGAVTHILDVLVLKDGGRKRRGHRTFNRERVVDEIGNQGRVQAHRRCGIDRRPKPDEREHPNRFANVGQRPVGSYLEPAERELPGGPAVAGEANDGAGAQVSSAPTECKRIGGTRRSGERP